MGSSRPAQRVTSLGLLPPNTVFPWIRHLRTTGFTSQLQLLSAASGNHLWKCEGQSPDQHRQECIDVITHTHRRTTFRFQPLSDDLGSCTKEQMNSPQLAAHYLTGHICRQITGSSDFQSCAGGVEA
ncbi:hypothetical protein Y1Q_0000137 [Alligator mississippiensis]|uniref:Uncharacterized protein n=1 Tax=Alligator mississippiensis TaxID=8496 RepID=A0A151MM52_ALLMI|nr:hypothetical protein Y1Q_0000137 [Alligator mississippiensis]